MDAPAKKPPRIHWLHVSTVGSAAVLIAAEVFGATFAGAWAAAILFDLGDYAHYGLQAIFFLLGMLVMVSFLRSAVRAEPLTTRD